MVDPSASEAINQGGKFLNKLIETLADVYEPRRVRKLAAANYERAKLETKAKVEEMLAIADADIQIGELTQRAKFRLATQLLRQQQNLDAIIAEAEQLALPDSAVSDEPLNPDWVSRFFSTCQDVSEAEIRTLFARLLAGEVAQPGSFSRRSLALLPDMSAPDAALFKKAARLFWFIEPPPAGAFIPLFVIYQGKYLNTDEMITLGDLGILHPGFQLNATPPCGAVLRYGSRRFEVRSSERQPQIRAFLVTGPAQELFRICDCQESDEYLKDSLDGMQLPPLVQLEPLPL